MQQITETSDPRDSSSGKTYETIVHADGKIACNCQGWATKKLNKVRTCKHCKALVAKHGLLTSERGDYLYAGLLVHTGPASLLRPATKVTIDPSMSASIAKKKASFQTEPKVETRKKRFNVIAEVENEPDAALFVNPMLASPFPEGQTLANFCASSEVSSWAMEEKFDGHRVVVTVNEGVVKAWSRPRAGKGALVRELPSQIAEDFALLPTGTYDGELMIAGGRSYNVTDGKFAGKEIFIVFDILSLLGMSTTGESYDDRRSYLTEIFNSVVFGSSIHSVTLAESKTPSVAGVQAIWARDGEGAILKRRSAHYRPGARSQDFIKVKALDTMVLTVTGFEAGKSGPHSVVCLSGPDGSETKVKALDNDTLRRFDADPDSFIGRKLRIEFQERTPDKSYRHPRFDRFEDE